MAILGITMNTYYTKRMTVEILSNTVKIINHREKDKIYRFNLARFNQLVKIGGKGWKIETIDNGYTALSFNPKNRHLSSAGGGINSAFDFHDYQPMLKALDEAEQAYKLSVSKEEHDLLYGDWLDD
jgi:hypothetical protein